MGEEWSKSRLQPFPHHLSRALVLDPVDDLDQEGLRQQGPRLISGDAALLSQLAGQGAALADPLWPMPLWDGYEDELSSRVAELNNCPSGGLGGSITAALFLRRFVADPARWIHLDLYAWNGRERPARC